MLFDEHQRSAVKRMTSGSILIGGTGSGKSRTALVYFFVKECGGNIPIADIPGTLYSEMERPKDLYVITTAAKRDKKEWEQEMIPFLLFTDKERCASHISVVIDSWNNIAKYVDVEDAFFIFDEQRVVGSGKWSKSFIKIAKKNHWILLTATPGDTWSDYIPVFIANGFFKNRTEFYTKHVVWSRYTTYPKIEKYLNVTQLERLRDQIQIKMDVVRKTRSNRIDILTKYDEDKYRTIVRDRWNVFDNTPIENAAQYTYTLRRVVNSDPSRLERLKSIIDEHKKLIIFYNFNYELMGLREFSEREDIVIGEWNGDKHLPIPVGEKWLYLVQYNAGAEGWNCVDTNTMVFFSLSYSYRMMHQAAGRIDRRNTPFDNLYYYYLYSDSNVDRKILEALKEKKDFNEKKFYDEYLASHFTTPIVEGKGNNMASGH